MKQHMLGKVTALHLGDCNRITDHGIAEISRRCKGLKVLSLAGCSKLSDGAITAIHVCPFSKAARGHSIVSLDLTFCIEMTCEALAALTKTCTKLHNLNLSGCSKLTDSTLKALCKNCGGLQSIGLAHCRMLTDRAMKYLVEYLWIEDLDVSYCSRLTDKGMCMIASNFTCMHTLNLAWCRKISDLTLQVIAENMLSLKELNITACDAFSEDAIVRVKEESEI